MKKTTLLYAALVGTAVLATSTLPAPPHAETPLPEESLVLSPQMRQRMDWMEKCLQEIETIKVGATRKDVAKVFTRDGGFQPLNPIKLVYRRFHYIKVDVKFKAGKDAAGRAILKSDDVLVSISKPYLERPLYG
jgi:hypothetical protein